MQQADRCVTALREKRFATHVPTDNRTVVEVVEFIASHAHLDLVWTGQGMSTETVMACKDGVREKIVYEVADLWFHSMLALSAHGLSPADVLAELRRREGLSGLEEFAARKAQSRDQEEKKR